MKPRVMCAFCIGMNGGSGEVCTVLKMCASLTRACLRSGELIEVFTLDLLWNQLARCGVGVVDLQRV